jgi:hypothetical protein
MTKLDYRLKGNVIEFLVTICALADFLILLAVSFPS